MKLYKDIDYYIYREDFPAMGVHGFVGSNQDGTASIYINALYCERIQKAALRHELRHVALSHLWRDDIDLAEKELVAGQVSQDDVKIAKDFSWVELKTGKEIS